MLYRPSNAAIGKVALLAGALLAILLLAYFLQNSVFAQDSGTIEYPENATEPVATFTADDPEDRMIYWSVLPSDSSDLPIDVDGDDIDDIVSADAADAAHFMISMDGVLSFNIPPDHEMPMGGAENDSNTYKVVVVASDNAPGAGTTDDPIRMGYKKVVVEVTDVDEPGVVTLSSLQPQVGADLIATLVDPEVPSPTADDNDLTWKWEKSQDKSSWEPIDGAGTDATYSPYASTEDYYLRVTATYDDDDGNERTFAVVSVNRVRAAPESTDPDPAFPTAANANNRSVDENSPAETEVGKPVEASDTGDEVLTYSLTGSEAGSFRIDPETGQITVGPRTMLDHEMTPTYSITVNVIGAGGGTAETANVVITVNDVNEAPMMTGGVTMMELQEYDADTDAPDTEDTRAKMVSTYMASDPEEQGAALTWSLKGADMDKLMISGAGALTFKEAPNYEMPADAGRDNVYNVTVVATDTGEGKGNKMTAERMVVIMITNAEEDGTVKLSAQQPKIGVEVTASVTDPDGTPTGVTWKWERDDDQIDDVENTGADEELIGGAESATYTPTSDDDGKFLRAIATYTDGKGKDTSMATSVAEVEVRTDNPPEFSETEDGKRSIEEGMSGDVGDPVRATDMEMTQLLTYSLSRTDASSFDITSDTDTGDGDRGGQISVKAGVKLDYETKSSYMVTVTATDSDNLSASIDVTIKVTDMDEEPMVTGDAEKDYQENGTRMVARYTADDPEDRMIYWSVLPSDSSDLPIDVDGDDIDDIVSADAADAAHFMISMDGVLSFNIPPDHEMPMGGAGNDSNTYKVVVVASDNAPGAGTTDDPTRMGYKKVVVEVTDVDEPGVVTLSSLQPQVGADLIATLAAPEQHETTDTVTWKWEKSRSRSSGWSEIDGAGETDTYQPDAVIGYIRATATYTDSDNEERTAPGVSVNRVRAAPESTDQDPAFPTAANANNRSVDENSPAETEVGKPVEASDTGDEVLTYSLTGSEAGSFRIDPETGQITVGPRTMLDHEMTPTYSITVNVIGAGGGTAETANVVITVNDVNEAPMMTGGVTMMELQEYDADTDAPDTEDTRAKMVSTYMASDPEEQGAALTWSLKGADMDKLMISGAGALTFKEAPNYEMPADAGRDNVYNVTVVATDTGEGKGNKMTAERMVVIMITNAEEDGTVKLSAQQPKIGVEVTASVTDPDGTPTGVTWKWERDDDQIDDVENTGADEELIGGAESATYTPTSDDDGKFLRAIATYTDGKGKDTSMATSVAEVEVRTDNPPEFSETEDGKRSIEEGMSGDVGDPVRATDMEMTQLLTYSLSGTDASSFDITSDTGTSDADRGGQISVASGVKLDHETKNSYMVTVTATDPDNLSASIDVTIEVTDVDEAPEIERGGLAISGMSSVSYAENRTDAVAEYTLAGPMADMARWTLEGDDAGDFMFSGGMLSFRSPSLDYENPTDMGRDNTYMVTLKASDGTYMDTHDVMVMVTNVEELGMLAGQDSVEYMENGQGAVETYTADGPVSATWSLDGDDMGDFTLGGSSGELVFVLPPPDFEAPTDMGMDNMYQVTVKAEAGGEMDMMEVTINVTNEDEPGTVSLTTMNPLVGTELTASVDDPDASVTATWQWARSNAMDGTYINIDGATNASYTPTMADDGMWLRATASYDDGVYDDGVEEADNAMETTANAVNSVPEFLDAEGNAITEDTRSVDENTAAGENVGDPVAATDANTADTLAYTLGGADMASFDIDSNGQITVGADTTLDYETLGTYSVTVTATDMKERATIDVTIMVKNVDEAGTVTLSLEQPAVGTELMATLTDLDGVPTDLTWQWANSDSNADDAAWEDIEGATGESYTPGDADDGMYLRATASYTDPQGSGKSAMTATANAVTSVPEFLDAHGNAITEDTRSVDENTPAGENVGDPVTATDANTGDILAYTLGGDDMASFVIDATNGQITVGAGTTLDYETQKKTYSVTVTATDGRGESATVDVTITITVNNVDEPGTVTLSLEQPAVGTELMATLTDLDGEPTDVTWEWARSDAMDGTYTIIDGATDASYTPGDADDGMYLQATASYTDPQGSGKSAMMATANAVTSVPEFLDAHGNAITEDTRSVDENTPAGENVGDPVTATDANTGDILAYTLGGDDMASFVIDATNGQITVGAGTTLDYETQKKTYSVTVTATDGRGESATVDVTITITVNNVDEPGTVTLSLEQPAVGTELMATLTDLDGEPTDVTWEWARSDAMDGTYTIIDGATDASYTPGDADDGMYLQATASYTDPQGSGKSAMMATANAVNSVPEFLDAHGNAITEDTRSVDENTGAGGNVGDPVEATDANTGDTLAYTLGGADMASFDIDSNGQITVGADTTLDYETLGTYSVTVTATDMKESATIDVTITVNNMDEPGTVILSLGEPVVGIELMATLTDLDGEPTDLTWQWANSDSKGEDAIWTGIEGATGASYTPVATEVGMYLRATASYTDPQGSGKTAVAASERAVKASNNAPEFPSDADTRSVEENTAAGENVGPLVLAMDADHDTLIYTLGGADMAAFGINEQTGQLVTAGALDYETLASYTVDVTATDPAGAQDTVTVTISVTNVDEDGTVTLSTADPMFGEEITGTVSDIDGDPTGVTWQWARETADGYADISGATSAGYTPVAEDNGKLLRATASYSDPQGSGKTAMAATANAVPARDPDYYDANGDGVIDRDEAVTAVTDYFADRITKDETIAVITRYFES